jgi:uncharacterized membrane protein
VIAAITSCSVGNPELARSKAEAAVVAATHGDFGLSAGDMRKLAQKIQPNQSAIIILFENAWERKFKDVVKKHGGTIIAQKLLTSENLAKAARELADGAGS